MVCFEVIIYSFFNYPSLTQSIWKLLTNQIIKRLITTVALEWHHTGCGVWRSHSNSKGLLLPRLLCNVTFHISKYLSFLMGKNAFKLNSLNAYHACSHVVHKEMNHYIFYHHRCYISQHS